MPLKNGQPTAAERRNTTRVEGNRQYLAGCSDDQLAVVEDENGWDPETMAMVNAERKCRAAAR